MDKLNFLKTRKHSSRMGTDRAATRMSSDRVAIRPIVERMTDACENITYPCGRYKTMVIKLGMVLM